MRVLCVLGDFCDEWPDVSHPMYEQAMKDSSAKKAADLKSIEEKEGAKADAEAKADAKS